MCRYYNTDLIIQPNKNVLAITFFHLMYQSNNSTQIPEITRPGLQPDYKEIPLVAKKNH